MTFNDINAYYDFSNIYKPILDKELFIFSPNESYLESLNHDSDFFIFTILFIFALIAGSFSISSVLNITVKKQIKEYGILRAIGGTEALLRRIIAIDVFIFFIICLPIAILISCYILKAMFENGQNIFIIDFNIYSVIKISVLSLIMI